MAWNYEFPYRKLRALQDGIRVLWLPQEPVNGAQKSPHCRRLVVLAVLPLHIHNEASHMYIQLSWVEVLKVSPPCRTSCRKSRNKDTLLSVFFVFTFSCTWTELNKSSSEIPAKRTSNVLPLIAIATLLRFVVWVHPFTPSLARGKSSPNAVK